MRIIYSENLNHFAG